MYKAFIKLVQQFLIYRISIKLYKKELYRGNSIIL